MIEIQTIQNNYKAFSNEINRANKIVLIGHLNPDGDCIGALTGLKLYIERCYSGKEISIVVPTEYPHFLDFIAHDKNIIVYKKETSKAEDILKKAEAIICMDLNSPARAEGMEELIRKSNAKKILIDHHISPDDFADITISTTQISSTCELTYWLIKCCSDKICDNDILRSLYTGMITDTNNFANSTFPTTFLMAAEIAQTSLNCEDIINNVLNSYSENRMRLMGEVLLNKMRIIKDLKASIIVLDLKTQKKFNFQEGDSEGFVNLPLKIKGIKVSGLFTEQDEYVRVSLRSKGDISVNDLSLRYFNGGGHFRAAGGKLTIPIEQVEEYFEKSLREFLNESKA